LPSSKRLSLAFVLLPLTLAGCAHHNDEFSVVNGAVGQEVTRTSCPAVAVPAYTGDVTLFDPPQSRDASAIDVVATITDVRGVCDDTAPDTLKTTATFRVDARRRDSHGARDVVLPYFATVVHEGDKIVAKSISRVSIHFDDGQLLASTTGQAHATVNRAEATLPQAIRERLARKRKPTDPDASIDPMSDPTVKAALAKATFELLIGFQLTQEQLAYNATR